MTVQICPFVNVLDESYSLAEKSSEPIFQASLLESPQHLEQYIQIQKFWVWYDNCKYINSSIQQNIEKSF